MKVKAVVICHDQPEEADALFEALSGDFDVALFDSGSERQPSRMTHSFPNIYWGGCWLEAMSRFGDFDAVWLLGADIGLMQPASRYLAAIRTALPFGVWSPTVQGRARQFMRSRGSDHVYSTRQIEGMCFALSREAMAGCRRVPPGNLLGWGLDIWMCWTCRQAGMRNLLDDRVFVHHPAACGYDVPAALHEMYRWFQGLFGPGWRLKMDQWYEDHENNVLDDLGELALGGDRSVSVVMSAWNNRQTMELALESFQRQSLVPVEVIVADDGSADGTLDLLDRQGERPFRLRYVTRRHAGYDLAGVNNLGARHATGDRILFTNADQVHHPDSVAAHAELADCEVGGGLVTGIAEEGVPQVALADVADFQRVEALSQRFPPRMTNADWLAKPPMRNYDGCWGGNLSCSRAAWSALGMNGEYRSKYGGEDADFVARAIMAGYELCWVPESRCYHFEHPARAYKRTAAGADKFKEEYVDQ